MGEIRYCTKCGKPLKDGARFCSSCGAKVKQEMDKISSAAIYETYEDEKSTKDAKPEVGEIEVRAQWEEKDKKESKTSTNYSENNSNQPSSNYPQRVSRQESKGKEFLEGAIIGALMAVLLSGALVHPDRIIPAILVGALTGGLINRFDWIK